MQKTLAATHWAAIAALAVLFAALYVPWSGTEFLVRHWMKIGTFAAPMLVFVVVLYRDPRASWGVGGAALAMWLAYVAHQFEEHWIDLYGRDYAFIDDVNAMFPDADPLTPAGVYVINTALVWLVGFQAMLWARRSVLPAAALWGIVLVNAFAHVGSAVAKGAYNPGLVTAVLVFVPISVVVGRWMLRAPGGRRALLIGFLYSLIGHVIMVAGLIASGVAGVLPELGYFALLVAYSLVPSLLVVAGASRGEAGSVGAGG